MSVFPGTLETFQDHRPFPGPRTFPTHPTGPFPALWADPPWEYLEPLFFREGITVIHFLAMPGAAAEHLLLLFLAGEPLHLGVVLQDPGRKLVLLHQPWLPLGIPRLLAPPVQVHALPEQERSRGIQAGVPGVR